MGLDSMRHPRPKKLDEAFVELVRTAYLELMKKNKHVNVEQFMNMLCAQLTALRNPAVPRSLKALYECTELALVWMHNRGTIKLPQMYLPK